MRLVKGRVARVVCAGGLAVALAACSGGGSGGGGGGCANGQAGSGGTHLVNVDARANRYLNNPVAVPLAAGEYDIKPVGVAQGGAFNAWNPFGTGATWWTVYFAWSDEFLVRRGEHGGFYATDVEALAHAETASFALSAGATVYFSVADSAYDDNTGGVSLLVTAACGPVGPRDLAYSSNPAVYTRGTAIAPNTPSHAGGAVTSFAAAPALPPGLALDASTGVITGTPTATSPATDYLVTASGPVGSATVSLRIAVGDPMPASGLIAHYPFGGDARDASGSGNHGTVRGATPTADRFGIANAAYAFDGVSSEIVVPDSASLNPSAITLSLWVRPSALACFQTFLSKGGNGSGFTTQYGVYACGVLRYLSANTFQANYQFSAAAGLSNQQWHHVALTHGGGTIRYYIDGALSAETTTGGAMAVPTTQSLYLGSEARRLGSIFFAGALDDVRLYNRALDAAEVLTLYHEGGWGL
jgi:hypothetical protein